VYLHQTGTFVSLVPVGVVLIGIVHSQESCCLLSANRLLSKVTGCKAGHGSAVGVAEQCVRTCGNHTAVWHKCARRWGTADFAE
jgi:hypothetical protein